MTRILSIIALLGATQAVALTPDNVVMACKSDGDMRQVYVYKKYVMFGAGIVWPYNLDTKHAVDTYVGDYRGWSKAVFDDPEIMRPLAANGATPFGALAKIEKTTTVNFKLLRRDTGFEFFDKDDNLIGKSEETLACEDATPR